jgi:phosphoribosylamine--glycine ligase
MNILLLGSGGREHALAWKLTRSKRCSRLYIAPGNAGTAAHGENVALDPLDFAAVGRFVLEKGVDMVVVGPEEPLVRGIADYFRQEAPLRDVALIGPSGAGAQLEGSKAWAKQFMHRHGVPTAAYREFGTDELEAGIDYLRKHPLPIVLKADGLAAGKGVVICQTYLEADAELRAMLGGKFGEAGQRVVVEQFLDGVEFSVFVLTDGESYRLLPEAKDYKRAGENDTGPNTGGMGAVSPVPFFDAELLQKVEHRIIHPTVVGLRREKIPYTGFIFFGLIVVNGEPYVIEYNCRLGDPETEVVLPRLRNDLVALLDSCARGGLAQTRIAVSERAAATVMLVSGGYPGAYEKGKPIRGLAKAGELAFHAGTRAAADGKVVTSGGRVIALTGRGASLQTALRRAYRAAAAIDFEGKTWRRDIGKDMLTWQKKQRV